MSQGWGKLDEEIVIADICERFGWTFDDYQNQPWWFLEVIKLKMRLEGEFYQKEERKLKKIK